MKKYLACFVLCLTSSLHAQSFVIENGETVDGPVIMSDYGDVGIIQSGGTITGNGGNDGVDMENASQALYNNGTISTTGGGTCISDGNMVSANLLIVNNGVLTNTGTAPTIGLNTPNCTIVNNGTVTTILESSALTGYYLGGVGIQLVNSGTLTTIGGSYAIDMANSNQVLINSGTISSINSSVGTIFSNQGTTMIINSGIIKSTSIAIYLSASTSPTLTLLKGSNIQGNVLTRQDTGDLLPLNLNVENGLNLALTVLGGPIVAAGIQDPYVISDGVVIAVVDPTGLAMQADVAADLSDALLDGLYFHRRCGCGPSCGIWTEGIGSYRKRDEQNTIVSFTNSQGGVVGGYDLGWCRGSLSLLTAFSWDRALVAEDTQRANLWMGGGGAAYTRYFCETFFALTAFGGYVGWDNRRTVANNLVPGGLEEAAFTTNGGFATAELTLGHPFYFPFLFCNSFLSCNLRYAGLFLGNYSESGSLADLSVEDRSISLLTARFEGTLGDYCRSGFIEPFIGLFARFQVDGYDVESTLLGESLTFYQGGPRNLVAFLMGIRGRPPLFGDLYYNVEVSFDSAKSTRILGEAGISF